MKHGDLWRETGPGALRALDNLEAIRQRTDLEICNLCGEVAEGYARIGRKRYCHTDTRECYKKAQADHWRRGIAAIADLGTDEPPTYDEYREARRTAAERRKG